MYDGDWTLSLQSCSCLCFPGRLPSSWHASCVATRTSTLQHCLHQKTRPNETSVLASAPTCRDSTNFSDTASSNKGLCYTQNFGKKSEKRRDEVGCNRVLAKPHTHTHTLSLSLSLSLLLSLFSITLCIFVFCSCSCLSLPVHCSLYIHLFESVKTGCFVYWAGL